MEPVFTAGEYKEYPYTEIRKLTSDEIEQYMSERWNSDDLYAGKEEWKIRFWWGQLYEQSDDIHTWKRRQCRRSRAL